MLFAIKVNNNIDNTTAIESPPRNRRPRRENKTTVFETSLFSDIIYTYFYLVYFQKKKKIHHRVLKIRIVLKTVSNQIAKSKA